MVAGKIVAYYSKLGNRAVSPPNAHQLSDRQKPSKIHGNSNTLWIFLMTS